MKCGSIFFLHFIYFKQQQKSQNNVMSHIETFRCNLNCLDGPRKFGFFKYVSLSCLKPSNCILVFVKTHRNVCEYSSGLLK